jgi:hypothetical protein
VAHLMERERGQHQLHLEAEEVEGVGPLGRVEGAEPAPAALARVEQALLEARHQLGLPLSLLEEISSARHGLG